MSGIVKNAVSRLRGASKKAIRNVRNFWIEAEIDGRSSAMSGGPSSKDGGFYLTVKMRDGGEVLKAFELEGKVDSNGDLLLIGDGPAGNIRFTTKR